MSNWVWRCSCASLGALLAPFVVAAAHAGVDTAPLLKGVITIASPGSPGAVAALGDDAEAVIVGRFGRSERAPVVVAAQWGKGRVVAFGHSGYLDAGAIKEGDTGVFITNAVTWAGAASGRDKGALRVWTVDNGLQGWLVTQGFAAAKPAPRGFADQLNSVDVLVMSRSALDEPMRAHLAAFVQRGGGLLYAQTGWGWRQLNGDADIRSLEPSILLREAGIAWTDEFVSPTGADRFEAKERPGPLVRFDRAFDALFPKGGGKATSDAQAGASVALGLGVLPGGDTVYRPRLTKLLNERAGALTLTDKSPLKASQGAERALLAYQVEAMKSLAPEDVHAHTASAYFPGAAPADAPREDVTQTIDLAVEGWHSLGLYAPAGGVITVNATGPMGKPIAGLDVQIGCHTDRLWHLDAWKRVPEITLRAPIRFPTRIASAFGGLIYVDVPKGREGQATITVEGAVRAPLFVLGQTDPAEWRSKIRLAPGPWAELATSKVIVTVPSSAVRDLDDPTAVLETWNRVLDSAADLAGIPHERPRPQRYVADVQISAGYMHSGYPIMTHLDAAESMVRVEKLKAGAWGLFHELGHNHQDGMWTFSGTGEVTCNLFSLYLCETVCGLPVAKGHDAIDTVDSRRERTQKHLDTGAKFDRWKADPFLALEMYIQLREAFGWEPFKKVFAEYRTLGKADRPDTDDQKRDQWMVRMSKAVGRNLGPFFRAWGVPTSDAAHASIRDLPTWMPDGWPPAGH